MTLLPFPPEDFSVNADVITMDEFVDTFTETLISWSSRPTESLHRNRRSVVSKPQSEYVNIDCNLTCSVQTTEATPQRRILVCRPGHAESQQNGILVRTTCVEHRSGRLLHMILAVSDATVDFLDSDFARILDGALHSLTPEPETFYLTLEVPLVNLRDGDFTEFSPKLRRLSVNLGHAVSVDRNVVEALSLESLSFEGCEFKGTRVFQNESNMCDVSLLYTCPKLGEISLASDRTAWKKQCPQRPDNCRFRQQLDAQPTCNCGDYKSLAETYREAELAPPDAGMQLSLDYKHLFLLSLATNFVLSCILLIICLFTLTFYVQNCRRPSAETFVQRSSGHLRY
ncbi:unnamed protein product [Mesocestoides corti]|uniref:Uncharacterized protein n=2 Tax=Mesocestoides corti TaxID=53468 RepID=A0A0R3UB98_MESCO|nr:unnamed protein product [Mesocestoides corti]